MQFSIRILLPLSLLAAPFQALPQSSELAVGGSYAAMLEARLTEVAKRLLDERAAEVGRLRTRDGIQARQSRIRERMAARIGGLPSERGPLNARITGGFERDGYRVENLVYESLPGFRVTANLYLPTAGAPPYPAVIGVAGHSVNGKASATYQAAWIGFVKRGYVVLAFDPAGQGERLEYYDPDAGKSRTGAGVREHNMAGAQCLLTGGSIARYAIFDGIRAFDYLLTRKEVDPARVAVAGNSGGGTQAAYLAVFEPRLAAVVSSCYITGWRELWAAQGPQDAEQVFPGFLRDGFDFGDFLLSFAPKPILMTTAIRDYFPIDGARKTYRETLRLFELLGVSQNAGYFEYDDPHGWSKPRREAAYRWLDKHLQKKETAGGEPSLETEPESLLYATPTGQLATSFGSKTVQELNLAEARRLEQSRGPATRDRILRALELKIPERAPAVFEKGKISRPDYTIEKLEIESLPGVRIPALQFVPAAGAARLPAVVFVSSGGKPRESQPGEDIEAFVRSGRVVLAVDPRGLGEAAPVAAGFSPAYRLAARTWLTGQSLASMQVEDLLLAFRYLQSHPRVDDARISMFGHGSAGVLALLAAAVEPAVHKLATERSVFSYMDIVKAKIHENVAHLIVPGLLKEFDLPDALRLVAPRPVLLVSPVQPNGAVGIQETRQQVTRLGLTSHTTVIERPEGWPAAKVWAKWLAE